MNQASTWCRSLTGSNPMCSKIWIACRREAAGERPVGSLISAVSRRPHSKPAAAALSAGGGAGAFSKRLCTEE